MLEVVFLLSADVDVQSAYERFEDFTEGRGDQFLALLYHLKDLLGKNPRMGVAVGRGFRKLSMTRFDYGIFYTIEGGRIFVSAVLDLRQNPETIRARLGL